jgi:hypothetical protein
VYLLFCRVLFGVYAPIVTFGILRRAGTACAVVASGIALIAAAIPAQAVTSPGWRQVFSKHYGPANAFSGYLTMVALTASDAWAFGGTDLSGGVASPRPVAVHWNGRVWTASALPKAATNDIVAASAPAPDDIWAVTELSGQILHWNGRAWSLAKTLPRVKSPVATELTGVVALSARNVWVFGSSGMTLGWGTWHYNGKSWSQWHGNAANIADGSAVSARNIWAIGGAVAPQSKIVHYTGSWQLVNDKVLSGLQFNGIHAFSATNVWASASTQTKGSQSWLVHYNGHTWSKFLLPWSITLGFGHIVGDGHGGLWLSAFRFGTSGEQFYEVHRIASSWTRVRVSAQLFGLAHAPGTASVWGAGDSQTKTGGNAVIWANGKI